MSLSSGQSVRLASVQSASKTRVGRYGVELTEFEKLLIGREQAVGRGSQIAGSGRS